MSTEMPAFKNIEDQTRDHDGYEHSLHAIWRAVGKPEGKSPEDWLMMAEKLIEGMVDYHEKAEAGTG